MDVSNRPLRSQAPKVYNYGEGSTTKVLSTCTPQAIGGIVLECTMDIEVMFGKWRARYECTLRRSLELESRVKI